MAELTRPIVGVSVGVGVVEDKGDVVLGIDDVLGFDGVLDVLRGAQSNGGWVWNPSLHTQTLFGETPLHCAF
jgi:hypothetical protein